MRGSVAAPVPGQGRIDEIPPGRHRAPVSSDSEVVVEFELT
jgi:hypothetical protein